MPKRKFTAAWVDRVKPDADKPQIDYTDQWQPRPGVSFGLRVGKRSKTFVLFYRSDGRWQRLSLGRYSPAFTLADAHDEAVRKASELVDGADPAAARRRERASGTVADLADRYVEEYAKPRKRSWQRDQELLSREVLPAWGDRRAQEIQPEDVDQLVSKLASRAPIKANRVLAVVRKMFAWAAGPSRRIVRYNPAAGVEAPAKEKSRERVFSDTEIKALWTEYRGLNPRSRDCLSVIAYTAQRPGEVMKMRKQDLDGRWWTIPGSDTKNGLPHRVYLTDSAWKHIAPHIERDSDYVFPSPKKSAPGSPEKPISTLQKGHEKARDAAKLKDGRIHDWRRTAASRMASKGVARQVIGHVLNHVEGSITAVYDRHSYDSEKRRALELWEAELKKVAK